MRKIAVIAIALSAVALLLMPYSASSPGDNIKVEKEDISIVGDEVNERIFFTSTLGKYNGTIEIWATSNPKIECEGKELAGVFEENIVEINLGENGIVIPAGGNISINVSYTIDGKFENRIIYHTDLMEINIESAKYPRGNIPIEYKGGNEYASTLKSLEKGDGFWVEFVEISPGGKTNIDILSILAGSVAILLAIVLIALAGKKRKDERRLGKEPVEALELRKKLLTNSLKALEIEHDKKKIPDAYYRSIKDYFKGEAVKVLKELDRRK
ncbi:MAG: hypothetical protein U9O96_03670 [Candidatus Thermoplasmatota archaeon]|nr:hypothetical protein [Candidatus Thermoplasmatota archaeon]